MSSTGEKLGSLIGTTLWILFGLLYVFGMYSLITDDHRYTSKHVIAGAVIFPYAWYVGGKTTYHYLSKSPDYRQRENQCLDFAEAQGVKRKSRVYICECIADGGTVQQCNTKYTQSFGG